MIRNPIQSALGRSRPELSRLSEGIGASLRQFSIAQARYNDDAPSRPTSRQRSAAAAKELLSMSFSKSRPQNDSSTDQAPRRGGAALENKPATPRIISVTALRGGIQGRFAGLRKTGKLEGNGFSRAPPADGVRGGGFRGRGGFRGADFSARGPGDRQERFPGRGRGGDGARGGPDDRPARRRRQKDDEKEGGAGESVFDKFAAKYESVIEANENAKADGEAKSYNPTSAKNLLAELTGYVAALPLSAAPLANSATVLYHARMLGSGRPYNADDWLDPFEAKQRYTEGEGAFFPVPEAKVWAEKVTKMTFKAPPQETNAAVLEATLLGKYEAHKAKGPADTAGTIRNYTSRDGTWNAAAGRAIEAKVLSLLPRAGPGGAAAGGPQSKRA